MVTSSAGSWIRSTMAVAVVAAFVSVSPARAQVGSKSPTVRKPAVQQKTSASKTAQAKRKATPAKRTPDSAIPRFKIDETGALVPDLRSAAAIIYNPLTREVIWR